MRARHVPGLHAELTFAQATARIVRVRLDELHQFDPAIRDPADQAPLHDMRIAAKRLRYVLELAGHTLPEDARTAEAVARDLQERIGEIHDCDVLVPRLERHVAEVEAADAHAIEAALAANAAPAALARAAARAPHRSAYRGLGILGVAVRARRDVLYVDFMERWDRLIAEGFRDRVERGLDAVDGGGAPAR